MSLLQQAQLARKRQVFMVREGVTETDVETHDTHRGVGVRGVTGSSGMEVVLMLVLSRKVGESIKIDGDIKIFILKSDGQQVRIGIEAPMDTKILRTELVKEKKNG